MRQRLIVEGNDGWAITQLCQSNELPLPPGITKSSIGDFVKSAGGFSKVLELIRATLVEAQIKNVGIIVDANDIGPETRWEAIRTLLKSTFSESTLNGSILGPEGIILRESGRPVVGIWIMPDNQQNGYLEHFLTYLVDQNEPLWSYTARVVEDLSLRDFCKFRPNRKQKALLHTWLAWQNEPGRPFGVAMQAGYINAKAEPAYLFLEWMKATFQLSN